MTSATGSEPTARRSAFTLLEIVLVLGLIAFASAIVVANFGAMAERGDALSPEDTVKAAVRAARFAAAAEHTPSSLWFDEESGELVVETDGAGETQRFPLSESRRTGIEVRFYLAPASEGLGPTTNPSTSRLESGRVRFAPDRSSNPFSVEIDRGSGTDQRLVFDPFSSLVRQEEPQ